MTMWKERARRARLTNVFIADALGYSNRNKVSQAFTWDKVPVSIRMLIVLAERLPPLELNNILSELRTPS